MRWILWNDTHNFSYKFYLLMIFKQMKAKLVKNFKYLFDDYWGILRRSRILAPIAKYLATTEDTCLNQPFGLEIK